MGINRIIWRWIAAPKWMTATLILLWLIGGTGCAEYDHVEFSKPALSPAPVSFSENHIQLTEGTAVAVIVKAYWSDGDRITPDDATIQLLSEDPSLFDVELLSEKDQNYLFYGVAVGESRLLVRMDRDTVDKIPVSVKAYPTQASGVIEPVSQE